MSHGAGRQPSTVAKVRPVGSWPWAGVQGPGSAQRLSLSAAGNLKPLCDSLTDRTGTLWPLPQAQAFLPDQRKPQTPTPYFFDAKFVQKVEESLS